MGEVVVVAGAELGVEAWLGGVLLLVENGADTEEVVWVDWGNGGGGVGELWWVSRVGP